MQMAHVAVDRETGVVKMKKFVAVQDMGLIINRKTADSQIFGAMIMGIAYVAVRTADSGSVRRARSSTPNSATTNCPDWATSARSWSSCTSPRISENAE